MRFAVGVFFALFSLGAQAKPCANLLTTSFGFRGPWTAYLSSEAVVTIVKDGFTVPLGDETAVDNRIPRLHTQTQALSGQLRHPKSFASLPGSSDEGAYYAAVSQTGQLTLTLPDGRTLPFHLPESVQAASLYRTAIHHVQARALAYGRFGSGTSRREFVELSREAERFTPIQLYYSVNRTVFEVTVKYANLQDENEDLRNMARTAITEVIIGEDGRYLYWLPSPISWVDFSGKLKTNYRVLVPTAEEGLVLEIGKPRAVFEFASENDMRSVDFLRAVSPHHIVAGSTLGQVAVVDVVQSEITDRPSFPGPAFLGSMSAHHNGRAMEVWAVDSARHALYRWDSALLGGQFEPVVGFPADADPFQVASFSSRLPIGFHLGPEAPHGYFTNIREPKPNQPRIEQVVVQDHEGRIHALRDRVKGYELEPEREWVSPPPVP